MTSNESLICDNDLGWDGDVRTLDGQPYSGNSFLKHSNGRIEAEYKYEAGFVEGPCKEWHPNGQLYRQWTARRGVTLGELRTWHENGQLKSIGNYEFGVELQYDEWDATGKLTESRRIDKNSGMMRYVETMRERAKA